LNDSKQDNAALDAVEDINRLLAQYAAVEDVYLMRDNPNLKFELQETLTELYATVLKLQATAACHFARKTIVRLVRSTLQLDDWTKLFQDVKSKDESCKRVIGLLDSSDQRSGLITLREALIQQASQLQIILDRLQSSQQDDNKALRWFCDIPYKSDHDQVLLTLGVQYEHSGQWLLPRVDQWLHSHEPSVLWLCGTVGTGKSCAVAMVVQHLTPSVVLDSDQHVVYFYISQKQNRRSEPVDVFRCLVTQMASTSENPSIAEPIKVMFNERGRDRISGGGEPTMEECIDLMADLTATWPHNTIIIDALDECTAPSEVLDALQSVCTKSPSSVKVFLSSRMNVEIPFHFPDCERIQIDEGKNSGDIESYIQGEVWGQKRRLLDARRPDLEERLIQILTTRAQGMFIWVKLQLLVFFSAKVRFRLSKDVVTALNALDRDSTLPETDSLYKQIMELNTRSGTLDRQYAVRALQWVLFSIENLRPNEIATAVSMDINGHCDDELDGAMVLDICSNLIVLDEFGCCQLAHLSVVGFLLRDQAHEPQRGLFTTTEAHAELAQRCLSYIMSTFPRAVELNGTIAPGTFASYASCYWAYHCACAGEYREFEPMITLFESFMDPLNVSPAFAAWSEAMLKAITAERPTRVDANLSQLAHTNTAVAQRYRNHIISVITSPPFPGFIAASFGFLEILRSTPAASLQSRTGRGSEGCVHFAAWAGQTDSVRELLTIGCMDLLLQDKDGLTPLHVVSLLGYDSIAGLLLDLMDREAIIIQDSQGMTAMHSASYHANVSVAELLVPRMEAADFAIEDYEGRTALQAAVQTKSQAIVEMLAKVMHPEHLAIRDKSGYNAISWSSLQGDYSIVKILLSTMTTEQIMLQANDGNTALHLAAHHSQEQCVELLVAHVKPENLGITNRRQETPLHALLNVGMQRGGVFRRAEEIPQAQMTRERTALVLIGKTRICDLGVQNSDGRTPLHLAVIGRYNSVVEELVKHMLPEHLNCQDQAGRSAIHIAAQAQTSLTKLLLDHQVLTELKDHSGHTPLLSAALSAEKCGPMIEILLAAGADVNAADRFGWTVLHRAASRRDMSLTKVLISYGADINAVTDLGHTVLHTVMGTGDEGFPQLYLQCGVDPNTRNRRSETALHQAVYFFDTVIARQLIAGGADPMLHDGLGRTCFDWALQDPPILDVVLEFCVDAKQTDPAVSTSILRTTIRNLVADFRSENNIIVGDNWLGHCLLLANDDQEAFCAFDQAIANESPKFGFIHPVICDGCDNSNNNIKGMRFVCRVCADTDLCWSCMADYESGTMNRRICRGHDFMKIERDHSKWSLPEQINDAGETREQWLQRLAEKYAAS